MQWTLCGVMLLALAGCGEASGEKRMSSDGAPAAITAAAAIEFVGQPLPDGARDVVAAGEAGIDRLVLLRFDAPAAAAEGFAAALLGAAPAAGVDPGLGYLGAGLDWWPQAVPDAARGGQATRAGNRNVKLLAAPAGPGMLRIWVAVFNQ